MKRIILSAVLLLLFLIFASATIKIDKTGIDRNNIPAEISSVLAPDKIDQAIIFSNFRDGWYFFSSLFDLLILAGILWFGFSGRIKTGSEKLTDWLQRQKSPSLLAASVALLIGLTISFVTATDKHPVEGGAIVLAVLWAVVALFVARQRSFAVSVFYILIFFVLTNAIDLPLSYYRNYVVEHQFNLSTQTFGEWLGDSLKTGYIASLFMVVLIPFAYLGIRKRAKDWWLWVSVVAVPIAVFLLVVAPIYISPMFNKFEPLQDKALADRILGMAEKAGISGARVFQVDMSEQTQKINAYVTGLFGAKRIVLWDTTIKKMTPDEVSFVMAHEMGHYVLNHVWIGIGLFSVIFLILLFIIHKSIGWILAKYGDRFGFSSIADIASLPLLSLMLLLMLFLLDPLTNGFSRAIEHAADKYALNLTHDPQSGVQAFVKLANENLSNPKPSAFIKFWEYSHPPLLERIEFCKSYADTLKQP